MKNFKKALSLLLAVMMIIGTLMPVFAAPVTLTGKLTENDVQTTKPDNTSLTIHKLVADSYNVGPKNLAKHNGGLLDKTELDKLGSNVKGLAGVKFKIYKVTDEATFKNFADPDNTTDKPSTEDAMKTYITAGKVAANPTEVGPTTEANYGAAPAVNLAEGNYWVIETDRPSSVTGSLAVPFAISLPLMNQIKVGDHEPGTVYMKNVHVYPKNTEQKPKMDKAFGQQAIDGELGEVDSKMLKDWQETYGPIVDQYQREKAKVDARVGSVVPYSVKTSFVAGQKYVNLYWSDFMTLGLKYNKDIKIRYEYTKTGETKPTVVTLTNADFTIADSDNGFDLSITTQDHKTVIDALNEVLKDYPVDFYLEYSATVTDDAVVDMPESNNITFSPTEPNPKNTQDPTNPTNGEITVTKTWGGQAAVPTGETPLVTYILMEVVNNVETPVASITIQGNEEKGVSLAEGMTYTRDGYKVTFKGLDNNKTYRVQEFADGYKPTYNSAVSIDNTSNPDRITPTPPLVVTYGKKFVKADKNTNKTLAGAEFIVKNNNEGAHKGHYLALKDATTEAQNLTAYNTAQKNYIDAVNKANEILAIAEADRTETQKTELAKLQGTAETTGSIKALKVLRDNAYDTLNTQWSWTTDKDQAFRFTSDQYGRFEVTGLSEGSYALVEVKAPLGYALATDEITFTVDKDSYTKNGDVKYEEAETATEGTEAQKVPNSNLTIPQTGGIGTVIFAVVGIGLMAGAVVAMKRREAND